LHLPWLRLLLRNHFHQLAGILSQVNTIAPLEATQMHEKTLKYLELLRFIFNLPWKQNWVEQTLHVAVEIVGKSMELWHV
jgi:hypothetical protein